ncbi:MAG: hypothetical protein FWD17_01295 [Polyangiaceae bacterium]|nr:hypothetical protein [Polyangiaceae bacterium]
MKLASMAGAGAAVFVAAGALLVTTGTEHEKSLVTVVKGTCEPLARLEARAAELPNDPDATRQLAQAYLDAQQPGLALVLVESAAQAVRNDVGVRHVYARALVDEGRDGDALAVERGVLRACTGSGSDGSYAGECDPVLVASAQRRATILEELVTLGVEDALAQPEVSLVAYKNATREARIAEE